VAGRQAVRKASSFLFGMRLMSAAGQILFGVFALIAVGLFCRHLAGAFAFWSFPYEVERGDGDNFGFMCRELAGLRLYADPATGAAYTIYTPFYYELSSWLVRWLGVPASQGMAVMRDVNLVSWIGSFPLAALSAWWIAGKWSRGRRLLRIVAVGVAVLSLMMALNDYAMVLWLRPDTLLLLVCILTLTAASGMETDWGSSARKSRWAYLLLGIASAGCIMTKQHGLAVPLALAAYYLCKRRWRGLLVFGGALAGTFCLWTTALEWRSHGAFLIATFLAPQQMLNGSVKSLDGSYTMASWGWTQTIFALYYRNYWPVMILGGIGLAGNLIRRRLELLEVSWITVLGVTLFLSRNVGGSASYVWLWWWLNAILAAQAIMFLGVGLDTAEDAFAASGSSWVRGSTPTRTLLVLVASVTVAVLAVRVLQAAAGFPRPAAFARGAEGRIAQFRAILAVAGPRPKALLDRGVGAWVQAGGEPPCEACYVFHATAGGNFNLEPILESIRRRKFAVISLGGWIGQIPAIRTEVEKYYVSSPKLSRILSFPPGQVVFFEPRQSPR